MPSRINLAKSEATEASRISPTPSSSQDENTKFKTTEEAETGQSIPDPDIRSSLDDDLVLSEDSEDELIVDDIDSDKVKQSKQSDQVKSEPDHKDNKGNDDADIDGDLNEMAGDVSTAMKVEYGNIPDDEEFTMEDGGASSLLALESPSLMFHKQIQYRNLLDELLATFKAKHRKQNKSLEHLRIR